MSERCRASEINQTRAKLGGRKVQRGLRMYPGVSEPTLAFLVLQTDSLRLRGIYSQIRACKHAHTQIGNCKHTYIHACIHTGTCGHRHTYTHTQPLPPAGKNICGRAYRIRTSLPNRKSEISRIFFSEAVKRKGRVSDVPGGSGLRRGFDRNKSR